MIAKSAFSISSVIWAVDEFAILAVSRGDAAMTNRTGIPRKMKRRGKRE